MYIRKKLVRNDSGFPKDSKSQAFIQIETSLCGESIELHFHHCMGYRGQRKVKIISSDSSLIKEFLFTTEDYDEAMFIPISFFCDKKLTEAGKIYSLIYYDTVTSEGRFLTDLKVLK